MEPGRCRELPQEPTTIQVREGDEHVSLCECKMLTRLSLTMSGWPPNVRLKHLLPAFVKPVYNSRHGNSILGDITDKWLLVVWKGYHVVPLISREDSRLHACIVCASISCPNVRMEAFRPTTIDQQMDAQFQNFLANNKKGMLLPFAQGSGWGSKYTNPFRTRL